MSDSVKEPGKYPPFESLTPEIYQQLLEELEGGGEYERAWYLYGIPESKLSYRQQYPECYLEVMPGIWKYVPEKDPHANARIPPGSWKYQTEEEARRDRE